MIEFAAELPPSPSYQGRCTEVYLKFTTTPLASASKLMSPFPDVHDGYSDIETDSTVGYSTPSTAATAAFDEPPFLLRRSDRLPTLLRISNVLAIASFCYSIPFFGASTLFQTPFISTSTLEFNRGILNPPEPSSEQALLIKKRLWAHEDEVDSESEEAPSKRARTLAIRWTLATFVVAAISGAWTVFSVWAYGRPEFTVWLYIASMEVVLDALQVVAMIMIWSRCRRRETTEGDEFEESLRRILSQGSRYT